MYGHAPEYGSFEYGGWTSGTSEHTHGAGGIRASSIRSASAGAGGRASGMIEHSEGRYDYAPCGNQRDCSKIVKHRHGRKGMVEMKYERNRDVDEFSRRRVHFRG